MHIIYENFIHFQITRTQIHHVQWPKKLKRVSTRKYY